MTGVILDMLRLMSPLGVARNGQHWLPVKIKCPVCGRRLGVRVTRFQDLPVEEWKLQMSCHNGVAQNERGGWLCGADSQKYTADRLEGVGE